MLVGIQIMGILFGLFIMYLSFLQLKRNEFTMREWGFWSILGIGIIIISIFPGILDPLVKGVLKMQRALDFFIIFGFMFLIAAVFYTYMQTRKNQKRIENLVRKIALKK